MFKKFVFIFVLWSIIITEVSANDIYINQVGNNVDIDIVQDGSNNRVSRKEDTVTSSPNKATFIGQNQTLDVTQTGDNNFLGLYKHYYSSDNQTSGTITATQTGDNNLMRIDVHGDNNSVAGTQLTSNAEMDLEIDMDGNSIDAKQACSEGSYCIKDEMILNVYMADDNNIKLGQGYKISESGSFQYDGTEKGGHEMDLYVSGDRNDIMLSQRSQNNTSGHNMDVNIYSDDNDVHVIQESNSTKTLNLTINNDDNNVFVHQKKSHSQTATISLSGAYGTDLSLQMGSNQSTQAGSYSLTQNCQTVGGCAVSVVQN
jgi:hypothetical protein